MLEFARTSWLWLLTLSVALFAAYLLARRFQARRVTYGHVWQTVARKLRPPGWKRLIRTALTLLVAALILGSVVFFAAGLQRPPADKPAPLLVAIAIDCTASMSARHGDTTRREQANLRAQQIIDALGPGDRAIVFHFDQGRPLGTRWLKRGETFQSRAAIDFSQPDLAALAEALRQAGQPPNLPPEPTPLTVLWWLGDDPPAAEKALAPPRLAGLGGQWHALAGFPLLVESFGSVAENDGLTSLRYLPARPESGQGATIEAATRSGGPVRLTGPTGTLLATGTRLEVDAAQTGDLTVTVVAPDALALDDQVSLALPSAAIASARLLFPTADGEPSYYLHEALQLLLPGREVATGPGTPDADGLLVMDRFAPESPVCRAAICFGAMPAAWGRVGAPVAVRTGFQRVEPRASDFEMPDMSLLAAEKAWPLLDSTLRPIVRDPMGNVLIADGMIGGTRVLYCGFVPHLSTLLDQNGDLSGLLLLVRWLRAVQAPRDTGLPPVLNPGQSVDLRLDANQVYRVEPVQPGVTAQGGFTMAAGPDGRARLGPIRVPGQWRIVTQSGQVAGRFASLWTDEREQSLPYSAMARADLAGLNPQLGQDWRDSLPGLLLYAALALILLEWLLWLVGATE